VNQHKIGSGFGFHSTAEDVLAGIDLTGKLAIVTGGYSGIGLPTTDALLKAGAHMATPETRVGPGWESQFATNHLGHFALVNRLRPGSPRPPTSCSPDTSTRSACRRSPCTPGRSSRHSSAT
jgi:hypothetical protein